MTSAGPGGINLTTLWVNVAPSMAGIGEKMSAGGREAGDKFSEAFNTAFEAGISGLEYAMKHVFEGEAPEVSDFVPFFQSMEGMIGNLGEKMVGLIPLVGGPAEKFVGTWTDSIQKVTGLAGEFMGVLQEIGTEWQEVGRKIQGATGASEEQLENYLDVTQQILASGDIVHLKDVADAIGVIGDRVHNINNEQLREFTTIVAQSEELLGHINVGQAVSALNQWGVEAEDVTEKYAGLVHVAQDAKMPFDTLTRQLQQMGPILQDFGVGLDQTAIFMGRIAKEGFDPSRLAYSFQRAATQIVKDGQDLKGSLEGVFTAAENLQKSGDETNAYAYIESIFGPYGGPRTLGAIKNMHVAVTQLFSDTHEGMNENAEDITRQVEETVTLQEQMEAIRNKMMGDLRVVAEGFSTRMTEAGHGLSEWFTEHHTQVLQFAQQVTDKIFDGVSQIVKFTADGLGVIAPFLNLVKEGITDFSSEILHVFEIVGDAASHLPGSWGRAGKDMADAAKMGLKDVAELDKIDFSAGAEKVSDYLKNLATDTIPSLRNELHEAQQEGIDVSAAMDTMKGHVEAVPGEKTIKITGNTGPMEDGLRKIGITFDKNQEGVITKIHATNEKIAEEFANWFKENEHKELPIDLIVTPKDKHGNEIDSAEDTLGGGDNIYKDWYPGGGGEGGEGGGGGGEATTSSTQRPGSVASPGGGTGMVPTKGVGPASTGVTPYTGGSPGSSRVNWDAVAMAEASGDWHINTGNGFFGGLQFKQSTWDAVKPAGAPERADLASKEQQIQAAENLLATGADPSTQWPATYRKHPDYFSGGGGGAPPSNGSPGTASRPGPGATPASPGGTAPAVPPGTTTSQPGVTPPASVPTTSTPTDSDMQIAKGLAADTAHLEGYKKILRGEAPSAMSEGVLTALGSLLGIPYAGGGGASPGAAAPAPATSPVPVPGASGLTWKYAGSWAYFVNQYGTWWLPPDTPLPTIPAGGGTIPNPTGYHWEHKADTTGTGGVYVLTKDGTTAQSPPAIPPPPKEPEPAEPPEGAHEGGEGGGGDVTYEPGSAGHGRIAGPPSPAIGPAGVPSAEPGEIPEPSEGGTTIGGAAWGGAYAPAVRGGVNRFAGPVADLLTRMAASGAIPGGVSGAQQGWARFNTLSPSDQASARAAFERWAANGGKFGSAYDEALINRLLFSQAAEAAAARLGPAVAAEGAGPLARAAGIAGRGVARAGGVAGAVLPLVTETIWPSASTSATDIMPYGDIASFSGFPNVAETVAGFDKDQWTVFVTQFRDDLNDEQRAALFGKLSPEEQAIFPREMRPEGFAEGHGGGGEGHRQGGVVGRQGGGSVWDRFWSGDAKVFDWRKMMPQLLKEASEGRMPRYDTIAPLAQSVVSYPLAATGSLVDQAQRGLSKVPGVGGLASQGNWAHDWSHPWDIPGRSTSWWPTSYYKHRQGGVIGFQEGGPLDPTHSFEYDPWPWFYQNYVGAQHHQSANQHGGLAAALPVDSHNMEDDPGFNPLWPNIPDLPPDTGSRHPGPMLAPYPGYFAGPGSGTLWDFIKRGRRYGHHFQGGGHITPEPGVPGQSVRDPLRDVSGFGRGVDDMPYHLGSNDLDCSQLVMRAVEIYTGRAGPDLLPESGHKMVTGNEAEWLLAMGFVLGQGGPGTFRVGWETRTSAGGHTALTLPDGTNMESGSSHGVQFGGPALGADAKLFDHRAYLPPGAPLYTATKSGAHRLFGGLLGMQEGGFLEGHVPYLGPIGRDSVHAILEPGEFVVKRDIAMKNLNKLHLLNQGAVGFQEGGVAAAEEWVRSLDGQPYNADGWIDCSGLVSGIVAIMQGDRPHRLFNTTNFGSDSLASAQGFSPGYQPGALNVAVNPNPGDAGHMIAQFPDGTVVESSGSNGIQYGSDTSVSDNEFSRWYHYGDQTQNPGEVSPTGGGANVSSTSSPGGGPPGLNAGPGGAGAGFQMPAGVTQASQGYVTDPVSGQQVFLGPGKYYDFLYKAAKNAEELGKAQDQLGQIQTDITQATGKADQAYADWAEAQENFNKVLGPVRAAFGAGFENWQPGQPIPENMQSVLTRPMAGDKSYEDLRQELEQAQEALTGAQGTANDAQGRMNDAQSRLRELEARPKDRPEAEPITPEKHAQQLGKGLITGMMQALGFDDSVFDNPLDWGLTKLFTGSVNYGMGMLNTAQKQGSPLLGIGGPGGTQAAAPVASEAGSAIIGGLNSLLPGVDSLIQPTAGNIPAAMTPPPEPQPGPTGAGGGPGVGQQNIFNGVPIDGAVNAQLNQNVNDSRANTTSGNPSVVPVP